MESRKRKPGAAAFIGLGGRHPADPDVLRNRMQERDARAASDTRTAEQRWLGVEVQMTFRDKPTCESSADDV